VCRVVKSEYRFETVHERSGCRRVIVYRVYGGDEAEIVVVGIAISTAGAMLETWLVGKRKTSSMGFGECGGLSNDVSWG